MRNTNDVTFKLKSNCPLCQVLCSTWNFFLLDSSGWPPFSNVFPGRCFREPGLPGWAPRGLCSAKESRLQAFPGLWFLVRTVAMVKASIPNTCLCCHLGFRCPLCWPQGALIVSTTMEVRSPPVAAAQRWPRRSRAPRQTLTGLSLMAPLRRPRQLSDESACQRRRYGFDPWEGKISWKRKQQPTPVESPEQRNLVDYSPWGRKESSTTEDAGTHSWFLSQVTSPSGHPPDAASLLSHITLPCLITGCSSASPLPVSIFQRHIFATIFVYLWGIFLGVQAKKIITREKMEFLSSQFIPTSKSQGLRLQGDWQSRHPIPSGPILYWGPDFSLSLPKDSHTPESCSPGVLHFFLTFSSEFQEQRQIL